MTLSERFQISIIVCIFLISVPKKLFEEAGQGPVKPFLISDYTHGRVYHLSTQLSEGNPLLANLVVAFGRNVQILLTHCF